MSGPANAVEKQISLSEILMFEQRARYSALLLYLPVVMTISTALFDNPFPNMEAIHIFREGNL